MPSVVITSAHVPIPLSLSALIKICALSNPSAGTVIALAVGAAVFVESLATTLPTGKLICASFKICVESVVSLNSELLTVIF